MSYRELLLGAGHSRVKKLGNMAPPLGLGLYADWQDLTTVDINGSIPCDRFIDLSSRVWWTALGRNQFDEVHAYCVLEHLGKQGNIREFFDTFENIWIVLKPGGMLYGICPTMFSRWAWGDPGHSRIISSESISFLDRENYAELGHTSRSDYRGMWYGDFKCIGRANDGDLFMFALMAVKPARAYPKVAGDG